MDLKFVCSQCGEEIVPEKGAGTGFACDGKDRVVCYKCYAVQDEAFMKKHGRISLYLTTSAGRQEITNWPGSLRIPVRYSKEGGHNIARVRRDVWFNFDGYLWHGIQYGTNSELCYCRRTKQRLTTYATDARGFQMLAM